MSKCRLLPGIALLAASVCVPAVAHANGLAQGASPEREAPRAPSVYTAEGLLGPVRLGPTFGAGAPDGLRVGVFAKWKGLLGAGGAFSYLPTLTIPGVEATVTRASAEGFLRVHPFRGAFYLGVAGGYVQTKGSMTEQTKAFRQLASVHTNAYANSVYIAPNVGFQWMLPFGMTVGFDAGVEIPLVTNGPIFDAAKYGLVVPIEGTGELADAIRTATTIPVPVVHLLELGYAL